MAASLVINCVVSNDLLHCKGKSLNELLQLTIQQIRQDRSASDDADGDDGSVEWRPSYWLAFTTFGPPAGPNGSKVFRAELSNGPAKKRLTPDMTAEDAKDFFSPDEEMRGKRSRAEIRSDSRLRKQDESVSKRHEELVKAANESNAIEAFNAAILSRHLDKSVKNIDCS